MSATPAAAPRPAAAPARSAPGTVRRLIVYTILFALVVITANGVAGLLARLFETRPGLGAGTEGLALSLAFTLVGGPLAALLWWFVWRRLDGPDRSSVAWGLYVAAVSVVALITFSVSLLSTLAGLVVGNWSPESLANGIAWLAIWVAHRWMWRHPVKGPVRLATVPIVLAAAYGLIVGAAGAVNVLHALFDAALFAEHALGGPWWRGAVQALVWLVGGALVWWWHWVRDGVRALSGGFADVVLVLTGVLGAGVTALGGVGTALFVGLRAAFDRSDPWHDLLAPLGLGVAAAAVGAIVWLHHRRIALERSARTRSATRLVESGLGLIGAASGVGVVVNALLAGLTAPLAGGGDRELLLGGIAALLVGAPVWWRSWRPLQTGTDAGDSGRRVYLVAVFGVSAVVALVALLVVGYRIFEFALDTGTGGSFVDRVRAPLGLLVATALVATYHFTIWRRDRAAVPPEAARSRAIDRITLVAAGDTAALARAVEQATGASVTRWTRADGAAEEDVPTTDAVVQALADVHARRVLVVAGGDGRVEVIPLAD